MGAFALGYLPEQSTLSYHWPERHRPEWLSVGENGATLPVLGWREWVSLPELGIPRIKCKVDTGARTSALHAFEVEPYHADGVKRVRFRLHPLRRRTGGVLDCDTVVADERVVSDSGGHRERRLVIRTPIALGTDVWVVEMSLTARDTMQFRMLLGRSAMAGRFVVDAGASYLARWSEH
jgi:hypothetical protein